MADKLIPFAVKIEGKDPYQRLLVPGKDTRNIKSGCVILTPGGSVGEHSTAEKEEAIIILSGQADIKCNGYSINADAGSVVYVPPQTVHDVRNDGKDILRYVFLVVPVS